MLQPDPGKMEVDPEEEILLWELWEDPGIEMLDQGDDHPVLQSDFCIGKRFSGRENQPWNREPLAFARKDSSLLREIDRAAS